MEESLVSRIIRLDQERRSYIYDWDKVLPENRKRFDEIQRELMDEEKGGEEKLLEYMQTIRRVLSLDAHAFQLRLDLYRDRLDVLEERIRVLENDR